MSGRFGGESSSKGHSAKRRTVTNDPILNWADRGRVTLVFNQGRFYMCWVVNALGVCESLYMIKNPRKGPITLSKQELVNCFFEKYPCLPDDIKKNPKLYDRCGFRAGSVRKALKYVEEYGISMEEDWPWVGVKGDCHEKPNPRKVLRVEGIKTVDKYCPTLESTVISILNHHPLAAAIVLAPSLKKLKKGEIYRGFTEDDRDPKKNRVDADQYHAVLVVGYGVDSVTNEKYYVIRNSWGTEWADNGYGRVKRYLLSHFCYPEKVHLVED